MGIVTNNIRPEYDTLIVSLADYICHKKIESPLAFETARYCLADSIGCATLALSFDACTKLLGPWVDGISIEQGARVLGREGELDPIKAAFDNGILIRWLDYNDTWLAAEWGHPSDNLGGLLSVMDFVSRRENTFSGKAFSVHELLDAMIRCYEIQGVLALTNSFNQVGLDHVALVKIATTGVVTKLMGGTFEQVQSALSQAFVDGQSLRTYRHAPNTGSRKSWAAGDATSRGVRLAMMTLQGEKGCPSALSTPTWGFQDALFKGQTVSLERELNAYVMENILFKIAYPAEFHAQTAVECAIALYPEIGDRLEDINKINISTQEAAMRIIDKTGPLHNPADRDHCMQYMVAAALVYGKLDAQCYEDECASHPMIDRLREKMHLKENPEFSEGYLEPSKRSIANTLEIELKDGSVLSRTIEYPLGHQKRRAEGIPLLWKKFERNIATAYSRDKVQTLQAFMQSNELLSMSVPDFMDEWKVEYA